MNQFKSWHEYMNARGTVVEKPEVEKVPDYKGPDPKSPPESKIPAMKGEKPVEPKNAGSPTPYKTASRNQSPKKGENGLGQEGDQKLVYEPKTDTQGNEEGVPGGKKVKGWTTKTEEFIDKTRNMSVHEFTEYMLKENAIDKDEDDDVPAVTAYTTGKIHPHPPETVKYIVHLAKKNPRIMEALIQEMKRSGCLKDLLKSAMEHPDSHDHMSELLGDEKDGPKLANSLVHSMDNHFNKFQQEQEEMYESVAPPFGEEPSEEDNEEDFGSKEHGPEDENPHDDEEEPHDEESPEGEEGDEEGLDHEPEDENPYNPKNHDEPEDEEEPQPEEKPRKLKKKFPHHHLIDSMKKIPHMKDAMQD